MGILKTRILIAAFLLCGIAFAQGTGVCPSGMSSAWACSDGLGDGSNNEVGIYYHGNVSLSGGLTIIVRQILPVGPFTGTLP